jgi:hypothetical protein
MPVLRLTLCFVAVPLAHFFSAEIDSPHAAGRRWRPQRRTSPRDAREQGEHAALGGRVIRVMLGLQRSRSSEYSCAFGTQ